MNNRMVLVGFSLTALLLAGTLAYAGRDGAGDYAAPANSVNPAVTGTPIDPTDFNAMLTDIESAISESVYTDDTSSTDNCVVRADGTNGRKVQTSGVCVDDSDMVSGVAGITFDTATGILTGTSDTNTVLLRAYDVDGTAYTTFGTLTAGNTPSFELDNTTLDTAIAKGTWTASGTWTIPAVTFGGTLSWNGQSASGTLADLGTVTTADINGGTIDGTAIGGSTPAAATVTSVTTTGNVELGHATDTSLSRVSAGVAAVEGVTILTTATGQPLNASLTDIAALTATKGNIIAGDGTDFVSLGVGTNGQCLTAQSGQTTGLQWSSCGGAGSLPGDPGADSILFWDDTTDNAAEWHAGFFFDLVPETNDGAALGTSSLGWADGFFAAGATLDFNNSQFRLRHFATALTTDGGTIYQTPALVVDAASVGTGSEYTIDLSSIAPEANWLKVCFANLSFSGAGTQRLAVQVSDDNQTTWESSGYDTVAVDGSSSNEATNVLVRTRAADDSGTFWTGCVTFQGFKEDNYLTAEGMMGANSGEHTYVHGVYPADGSTVTDLRFFFDSDERSFDSGTVTISAW